MKKLFYNIRNQVILAILAIAMLVIGGHFFVFQPMLHDILFNNEVDQINAAADATAQSLNLEITLAVRSLESVAALAELRRMKPAAIEKTLATYDSTNPFFLYTWVMDEAGSVIAAPARPDRLGENRAHRDYFTIPNKQSPTHFQKVQISTRGRFSLVIGTAIFDDNGEKVGVLAGSLGLMDRNPDMYSAVIKAPFPDRYAIFLFSSNNILLAHSDKKLPQPSAEGLSALRNQPFTEYLDESKSMVIDTRFNGQKYVLSFSRVPVADWKIIVQVPESLMTGNVDRILANLTVWLGLLFLTALLIGLYLVNRFSGSLTRLTDALNAYGERNEVVEVWSKGRDEIADAIRAFNKMTKGRREIESKLQDSENRFRLLVDQASDAFFLHDIDGNILDVNLQACESLGYEREELLTMSVFDVDAAHSDQTFLKNVWRQMEPDAPVTLEGFHRRKDSSLFPVEVRVGLMVIGNERNILALARDVTDRKKAEDKLRQAHKMEAIGNLAGGIAHDFNNILTSIFGNVELLMLEIDPGSKHYEMLASVKKSSMRAKNLVDQILTFSRKKDRAKQMLRVDSVVHDVLSLMRSTIPTSIDIEEDVEHGLMMRADETELHQVVMNLCTNAAQAMIEQGGRIRVSLKAVDSVPPDVDTSHGSIRFMLLEVSDTGAGMDIDTISQIFEPYFTTKASGKGTGLGLAVVHGIVKSYGGHIGVTSEPGKGAIFRIYLPIDRREVEMVQAQQEAQISLRHGQERIMLIDDEELNVSVVKEMLTRFGYQVDGFTDPEQGWTALQNHPGKYDLVISDMNMPNMTGLQLAKNIQAKWPALPVILCTGYSEHLNRDKARELDIKGFVQKPVSIADLLRTVGNVLENKKHAAADEASSS